MCIEWRLKLADDIAEWFIVLIFYLITGVCQESQHGTRVPP